MIPRTIVACLTFILRAHHQFCETVAVAGTTIDRCRSWRGRDYRGSDREAAIERVETYVDRGSL